MKSPINPQLQHDLGLKFPGTKSDIINYMTASGNAAKSSYPPGVNHRNCPHCNLTLTYNSADYRAGRHLGSCF